MKTQTPWLQHVASWRTSGLTQAEYCRKHGLGAKSLSYWVRCQKAQSTTAAIEIIPVKIESAAADTRMDTPVILRLHGTELELSTAVSPRWLAELLQCLV